MSIAPSDLDTPQVQQIPQHTGAGKRVVQVQSVNQLLQGQVGLADRAGLVIDATPADRQCLGLACQR